MRYTEKSFSSKPASDDYIENFTATFGPQHSAWCACGHREKFHDYGGKCEVCDCQELRLPQPG